MCLERMSDQALPPAMVAYKVVGKLARGLYQPLNLKVLLRGPLAAGWEDKRRVVVYREMTILREL